MARLAAEVGFRVHVIDTRPLFANRERFPTASEVVVGFPGEIAHEREFTPSSFSLLLAHSAAHDLPVLEGLLRSEIRYIGVLGSSSRAAALASRLREKGYTEQDIARLHIPVGLDIGAESAEQMAVAVVAELLMVRNERTGQSMKLVKGCGALCLKSVWWRVAVGDADGWLFAEDYRACQTPTQVRQNVASRPQGSKR